MQGTDPLEGHLRRQIEHSRDFFWHRLRWRAVASYLPEDDPFTLVDVGAGAGLLALFLARDRPQATYHFVEPLQSLERHLERQHGTDANVRHASRYSGANYVTLLDVLEHQAADAAFLAQVVGRMDRGATLILTVPALRGLWSQWDVDLGHYRRYDRASLAKVAAGLPVDFVETSFIFPEMVPLAWMRKWRRPVVADSTPEPESALFPDLPRLINDGLYRCGLLSLALRRLWPAGSSLLAVLRRRR